MIKTTIGNDIRHIVSGNPRKMNITAAIKTTNCINIWIACERKKTTQKNWWVSVQWQRNLLQYNRDVTEILLFFGEKNWNKLALIYLSKQTWCEGIKCKWHCILFNQFLSWYCIGTFELSNNYKRSHYFQNLNRQKQTEQKQPATIL